MTTPDLEEVLVEWNDTGRSGLSMTFPQLFEAQGLRTPESTAVVHNTTVLTYRELNERANRLARLLIGHGAGPEELVALALPRSAEMLTAILAVTKAGAAWVPVDPEYPASRIAGLLASAGPLLALTTHAIAPGLPADVETIILDSPGTAELLTRNPAHDVDDAERSTPLMPDHAAYVIHTSGSTGAPKGVVVSHRGLASLAADHIERFAITEGDGVLQFASFQFDCSVGDIVMALVSGSALIIRPQNCLSGHQLGELIERTGATHVTIPPQVLAALPPARYPSLKTIATAGDVLTAELVSQWAPGRRMFNAYGPTEATVDAVATEVTAGTATPPIGRPMLNTRVYVLASGMRPVPVGEEGELFIAGAGLARGYLGQPAQTAERFVPCPYGEPGERMYRTGDIVRWRPDGNLEFLGRADEQVKIRGFRVEPREVETVLNRHVTVAASVVTAREDQPGNKRLVAYAVAADGADPDPAELRRHVAGELPDYLVPTAVVVLDAFPLTPNGKLDRDRLPEPLGERTASGPEFAAPRNRAEEVLAEVWSDVLGVDQVGIDDNYFTLGGDSILAIRMLARARKAGVVAEFQDLLEHQTIRALATIASPGGNPSETAPEHARHPLVHEQGTASVAAVRDWARRWGEPTAVWPLTPTQEGMLFRSLAEGGAAGSGVYVEQLVCVLEGELDRDAFVRAWQAAVDRHGVLRGACVWRDVPRPLFVVPAARDLPVTRLDFTDAEDADARLDAFVSQDRQQGFDLSEGPLMRLAVARLAPGRWAFVWTNHHLLLDGWSLPILLGEVLDDYVSPSQGRSRQPAPDFGTFARWIAQQDPDASREFWTRSLADFAAVPFAPQTNGPARHQDHMAQVSAAETTRLRETAQRLGVTLGGMVHTAWAITLAAETDTEDVAFGSVGSGRPVELDDVDRMVGMFINTVPLRIRLPATLPVGTFCRDVQQSLHQVQGHIHTPLARIARWSGRASSSELFDTSVIVSNFPFADLATKLPGLYVARAEMLEQTELPVTLSVAPEEDRLDIALNHDTVRVSPERAADLVDLFCHALTALADDTATVGQVRAALRERRRDERAASRARRAARLTPAVRGRG
ncbi:non-ribosomal peptide synthetase [Streptomyces lasiicapitis]|uniref:non-ribosomal peptide synthetase n=1 Tax=Streptomyces lasiicapitis TaxID=1923961 RepID=UPI00166DD45B|nr:non-ribosomal peptide synthetase [Streptomyces lasiicapitis]